MGSFLFFEHFLNSPFALELICAGCIWSSLWFCKGAWWVVVGGFEDNETDCWWRLTPTYERFSPAPKVTNRYVLPQWILVSGSVWFEGKWRKKERKCFSIIWFERKCKRKGSGTKEKVCQPYNFLFSTLKRKWERILSCITSTWDYGKESGGSSEQIFFFLI